jgi:hypothetical protein
LRVKVYCRLLAPASLLLVPKEDYK